jgi:Tetracyclin repressor-like, C-terminal domain
MPAPIPAAMPPRSGLPTLTTQRRDLRAERFSRRVFSVLSGYGLTRADAIDATRALRAALHGFVQLEAVGGFGLPQDVDRSFARLVELLDAALRNWKPVP